MGRRPDPKPRKVTVIRYQLSDGTRCNSDAPGAVAVRSESESYYLTLERKRIPLGTTDLAVAWARVREHLERAHKESLGISDDRTAQAARPIVDHLDDWIGAVAASGVTDKRVAMLRSRVALLVTLAGWERAGDVRKSSLQQALAHLQSEGAAGKGTRGASRRHGGRGSAGAGKGVGAQTRNHYLAAARQFSAWLADEGRLPADPLAGLKGVKTATDRRHDRRVPDDAEVRVLFDHLHGPRAKTRRKMSGPQRALGYMVAMCAGLRAGELCRLTRESFDLESGDVRVRAGSDKARKKRTQALPRWVCARLAEWFDAGGGLWGGAAGHGFPSYHPGRLLKDDLVAARAEWIEAAEGEERAARERSAVCLYEVASEDGPLYVDFHALRHWFVTQIASSDGVSPGTLQALARHSDPKVTLGVYSHGRRADVRAAVEQLPDLSGG